MLFYKSYPPSNGTSCILREIQILHMKWEENQPMPPPYIVCLANTEQNLYFYPKDSVTVLDNVTSTGELAPQVVITGPKNRPVGLKFGKDYLMIKVAFQPTGLYRLLKIPMQKTVNIGLDANIFFGEEVATINHNLNITTSYEDMAQIVASYIDKLIGNGIVTEQAIDRVAIKMLNPFSKNTLVEWASMACLSLRQFERNFSSRVGISPKMYIRIVRFENAMKMKNAAPEKSWSDIAYECDYNDSSHLLREFRQFADFPPGNLLQKQTSGYSDFPTG